MTDTQHRAPRLAGYDYTSPGWYFVTICTQGRRPLFGDVVEGRMTPSPAGEMVRQWWDETGRKYPFLTLDAVVVMPNHLHGLLQFRAQNAPPDERIALPDVMQWFKAMSTNAYIRGVKTDGWARFDGKLWQRSYHDHIVRDAASLETIRRYIDMNPARWHADRFNQPPG